MEATHPASNTSRRGCNNPFNPQSSILPLLGTTSGVVTKTPRSHSAAKYTAERTPNYSRAGGSIPKKVSTQNLKYVSRTALYPHKFLPSSAFQLRRQRTLRSTTHTTPLASRAPRGPPTPLAPTLPFTCLPNPPPLTHPRSTTTTPSSSSGHTCT